jgi:hypothetical protein
LIFVLLAHYNFQSAFGIILCSAAQASNVLLHTFVHSLSASPIYLTKTLKNFKEVFGVPKNHFVIFDNIKSGLLSSCCESKSRSRIFDLIISVVYIIF